ncbi:MAG: NAD(+)/NADH kinase [Chloroflexi bacterium]|nr:NAD(+)/NADH kinase [Chloroflexota bacterium]
MRRFGFAFNPTNPQARATLERARAWCAANGVDGWEAEADDGDRITAECRESDLVCVLGGDGTFLRAARGIGDSAAPTLGVNLGRVGFLAKVETDDLEQALGKVASGDFALEDRFRIEATLLRADGERVRHACLNEVVVARGPRVRMIQVEVEVSGSHLATWVSDGVVVATPTGSTAYSFSAGGSVLDPRLRNMIITSVAGYLSPLRSVVAGEDHQVRLILRQAVSGATISIDGQWDLPMAVGETVEVRALPVPLRMVELSGGTPFYDLLRTKASLLPY